jgi:hypothetical protein
MVSWPCRVLTHRLGYDPNGARAIFQSLGTGHGFLLPGSREQNQRKQVVCLPKQFLVLVLGNEGDEHRKYELDHTHILLGR